MVAVVRLGEQEMVCVKAAAGWRKRVVLANLSSSCTCILVPWDVLLWLLAMR